MLSQSTSFANFFAFEGDAPSTEKFLAVSLGAGCAIGLTLREYNLRTAAFPFDWLVTPHDGLIQMLKDDFQFFFNEEALEPLPQILNGFLSNNAFKNTHYNTIMYHEGDSLYDWDDLELVKKQKLYIREKYERRIGRFRNLRNYLGKVLFFRYFLEGDTLQTQEDQGKELKIALDQYFPTTDFELVIVQDPHQKTRLSMGENGRIIVCMGQELSLWMKNLQTLQSLPSEIDLFENLR